MHNTASVKVAGRKESIFATLGAALIAGAAFVQKYGGDFGLAFAIGCFFFGVVLVIAACAGD